MFDPETERDRIMRSIGLGLDRSCCDMRSLDLGEIEINDIRSLILA
jgi:hypothetical protein